jgi:hypothetical protein
MQGGQVSRRQLNALGITHNDVRHQVAARRWVNRTPMVVGTTTGPVSFAQRIWTGVLHAGPGAVVGGLTALEVHGLTGWHRDRVCVLVDDEATITSVPGIDFVRTRRGLTTMAAPRTRLPVCLVEPATLLFAGYTRSSRTACGLLAAVVQQRMTTPDRLARWIDLMQPLRRARLFRTTLGEIDGGAQSLAEIDVGRLCKRFGLPRPERQVRRRDSDGRLRFTDCEWLGHDGRRVVLEVDGAFHMDAARWADDIARERGLVTDGAVVLRCSTLELRREPGAVMRDLALLLLGRVAEPSA